VRDLERIRLLLALTHRTTRVGQVAVAGVEHVPRLEAFLGRERVPFAALRLDRVRGTTPSMW
jgi:hypothetical protein